MGSVHKRSTVTVGGKTVTRYRAMTRDSAGRQVSKTFAKKTDASAYVAQMDSARNAGLVVRVDTKITVADYVAKWLAGRPAQRPATERNVRFRLAHITGQPIAAIPVVRLTASDVHAWAANRSAVLSAGSMKPLVSTLRSILALAVADGVITRNPVGKVTLSGGARKASPRVLPLTPVQVAALAAQMPVHVRSAVTVACGTGLRIGELLGLTWSDVDLDGAVIHVRHQADDAPLKTEASYRDIPLAACIVAALRAHREAYPSTGYVWHVNGRPVSDAYYYAAFRRCARRLGLSATTHTCRHTYASLLLAAGVDVVTTSRRLGHRNASITLSVYAHIMPAAVDRSAGAVDAAMGGLAA